MNQSWGIIGVGHLGTSLVEGLCQSGSPPGICLSPRSAPRVRELAARFSLEIGADNQAVVDSADHVILSVRPDQTVELGRSLRFRPDQVVVSVAAAVGHDAIQGAVGAATAVRAMPVLSAAIGDSPTCIFPANDVAFGLFERLGPIHGFDDESAFDAAAVAAMYYAWVFALMHVAADWLDHNGVDTHIGRALVAQMTRAAANRSLASGRDMDAMAAEISHPDSFSGIGMHVLRERRALDAWADACQSVLSACRERGRR